MLCRPVKVSWHFGGTCCFHLQGWKVSQTRNQDETGSKERLGSLFSPEDRGDIFLQNFHWLWLDYTVLYILQGRTPSLDTVSAWLLFAVGCIAGILEIVAASIFKTKQNRDSMDLQQYHVLLCGSNTQKQDTYWRSQFSGMWHCDSWYLFTGTVAYFCSSLKMKATPS
jgi:hypothetical protein